MREVAKKWYCVQRQFNLDGTVRQEDVECCGDSKEEAIKKAKDLWEHFTKKEQERNAVHVCMWHSVKDDDGEWHSVWEDDEEYEDGMSYAGAYDVVFEISSDGEHELFTFDE